MIEAERARRASGGGAPWIRNVMPPNEAAGLIRTLASEATGANTCVFSPDGATLITGAGFVAISPDGNSVVGKGACALWDVASGRERMTLQPGVRSATPATDYTLTLWDAATGATRATLVGHADWVNAAVFSPDGATLASVGRDGVIRLWEAHTGAAQAVFQVESPAYVRQRADMVGNTSGTWVVAWSHDGRAIVAGGLTPLPSSQSGLSNALKLFDVVSGAERGVVSCDAWDGNGQRERLDGCGFSADGATLYASSNAGSLLAWDVVTLQLLTEPQAEPARRATHPRAYSPDGALFAQSVRNGRLEVTETRRAPAAPSSMVTRWVSAPSHGAMMAP
jgi:hypothetical protein